MTIHLISSFVGYNYRYWYRYTGPVFAWYRIPEFAHKADAHKELKDKLHPRHRHCRPLLQVSRPGSFHLTQSQWGDSHKRSKTCLPSFPDKASVWASVESFSSFTCWTLRSEERRELCERFQRGSHGSVRLRAPGWRPWRLCSSGAGSSVRATGMSPSPTWPRPSGTDWLSAPSSTNTDPISCEYTWNRTGERKQEISETYWLHSWLVCWQHKTIFMKDWSHWFCFRV